MATRPRRTRIVPSVELLEDRLAPSGTPWLVESFDKIALGSIPAGWAQWSSGSNAAMQVSSSLASSGSQALTSAGTTSSASSRTWVDTLLQADEQVGAAIYLNSLIPAQVLVRGSKLNTSTPTYYALSLSRGLQLQLVKVDNGTSTILSQVKSQSYFSNRWVQATLDIQGSTLRAQVVRLDTGMYLNTNGAWQSAPAWAITQTDSAITGSGKAGLARPASYTGTINFDDFQIVLPNVREDFETTSVGQLPQGWSQLSGSGAPFKISNSKLASGTQSLVSGATTTSQFARAWNTTFQAADVQAGAWVYLDSLIPAQVLARGQDLSTSAPSYYSASITRGLQIQILKVVNGTTSILTQLKSNTYESGLWVRESLSVNGATLRAQVFRPDRGQYLNRFGEWQKGIAWALETTDSDIAVSGMVGLARPASYTGNLFFDGFAADSYPGDTQAPTVTISAPDSSTSYTGTVQIQALAQDDLAIARVEFFVDQGLRAVGTIAPYQWSFDTSSASNGSHVLTVMATDITGNQASASFSFSTQNDSALDRPVIQRHYSHIRIAELAYQGTRFGSLEDQLLKQSVDLVVPYTSFLSHIAATAPNTPQLIYSNVTNLYQNLLADWSAYAIRNSLSREQAFFHVNQATSFTGSSPSSQPVNYFWKTYRVGANLMELTREAQGYGNGVTFGALGESVYIGSLELFREINPRISFATAGTWSAILEYAAAVDASGNPTNWKTLPLLTNTTDGLTRSGQILFDPPSDWKLASLSGSLPLYYVRFRTEADGTPPVAMNILGRDYVNAAGTNAGVIPTFDVTADVNHDGYLNDAEYAQRAPGKDARFVYESRLFYPGYGQMRFATNPSDAGFQAWAADYHQRLLQSQPLAAGVFLDNSAGNSPVAGISVLESTSTYTADYAAMLNSVARRIAPKWILMNTAGGAATADTVIAQNQAYFEEFAIRPLANTYQQFETLAGRVAARSMLRTPAPYAVIDSIATGGTPTDARTQLATLAYYYLLADPVSTFLDFFGGSEPATSWSRHWSAAAAYDIGQPTSDWSMFAAGADPANATLAYRIYQRNYSNALILYKPLSTGKTTGSTADTTATTHVLNGTYRPLQADGTLGAPMTQVSLRNGEGAILIRS